MPVDEFESIDWSNNANDEEIAVACEKDLEVLGCTGVEDELQEEISDVIQDFRDAGIKFWMLTGDQGVTAKEIGYNCGVMSRDPNECALIEIDTVDVEELKHHVKEAQNASKQHIDAGRKTCVLISGLSFECTQRLDEETRQNLLTNVLLPSSSVILYRSSPKQKATAVSLVK